MIRAFREDMKRLPFQSNRALVRAGAHENPSLKRVDEHTVDSTVSFSSQFGVETLDGGLDRLVVLTDDLIKVPS